ncbi:GIY-YIG catalytic domain-containing endonuclease [Paramecium bursaria Chlorella virus CZ-2]|nr:GIY-YIG catalytic domain-containing endonuclease [Paramecium bursaria Chlorella virus CZ-2]
MGFIYMLTSPSGKSYIGQTIRDIEERFKEHQQTSSVCVAISNAIKKYGWENFDKEWYECPDEDLNFDEELLVEEMGTLAPGGYNLREGGGSKGRPSEESRQKMSKAHIGKKGEKNGMYGKTHTEETKQKMSKAKSGERHPMYGKTGEKLPMYGKTDEKHPKTKRVYQYTLDGTYVDSFGPSRKAAQAVGKDDGANIRMCASGKQSSAYGFDWSYRRIL